MSLNFRVIKVSLSFREEICLGKKSKVIDDEM